MDRTAATNYLSSGGKRYFQDDNLSSAIQGTDLIQQDLNSHQEMLMGPVEQWGIAPAAAIFPGPDLQLAQAIARAAGGNVTSLTATAMLTPDNAGIVLVSAAAANVTITLPASNSANGKPLAYRFFRTDSTANTVSIAFSGTDSWLIGGGANAYSLPPAGRATIFADGVGHWAVVDWSSGVQIFSTAGTFSFTVPVPDLEVELWGAGAGAEGSTAGTQGGSGGGGGGYSRKRLVGLEIGAVVSVTVGAPGTGGPAGSGSGATGGGTTSFGSYFSATGGSAAGVSSSGNSVGTGGAGSGGDENLVGGPGFALALGGTSSNLEGGPGGAAPRGGLGGAAGASPGAPGQAPGGGGAGSGSSSSAAGGAGAPGQISVRW